MALWQAEFVASALGDAGISTELVTLETKGDKILDTSISKIGSKGVFTQELEERLSTGDIDIAVHSAKDMQSTLANGFEIIAFTEREKVNDVIVSAGPVDLTSSELIIGTSSTRRVALFRHYYPKVQLVDMRGNLQTRIAKMESGDCHALVLAYAGVHRMGYDHLIQKELAIDEFTPAVGQGSIAIESHVMVSDEKKSMVKKYLNHYSTATTLTAERSFLARLDGGCSIPVFALAKENNNQVEIHGGIISLDGTRMVTKTISGSDSASTGLALAESVLQDGGDEILKEIKDSL